MVILDSLVSFLDNTWKADNQTDWHQKSQGNLETLESHHKNNAFGKTSSPSLNLDVPLAQRSISGCAWLGVGVETEAMEDQEHFFGVTETF